MLTLATKITLLRVLLVPLVVVLLYFESRTTCIIAAAAFAVAGITDWMDGYVARHQHMVTNMGKFLDPLADKLLICAVLIMLVDKGWAPAWVVIIIVCRELIITGLRTIAIDEGIVMAADRYGKLKTVLQIAAILPLTLHYETLGINMHLVGTVMLYLSMIMALYSCCNYFVGFYRQFCEKQAGSSKSAE